ncbi:hypothetical protein [Actinoplanes utahensis]|uniref:Uncharacterized protein n=1 Tax=Actinoplanes utahensis TaxID=1869 RepID=A0A0A6XF09_ACTUT|nr:hypothetical protein [Actinoplanes utahensis]KHD78677.1 hypothetical protein MB27_03305 [Actinoplanes utahensis]GIF32014.1 hypothetical protein Aut01nite_50000 [Actinoplanes utahensis]
MNVYDLAERLPSIDELRNRCRALATLEFIQGSDYPYYTWYDEVAAMDNGGGDEYSIVFSDAGAFIRVFDHESAMSPYAADDHELWPGLLDGLPPEFLPFTTDPAFCDHGVLSATAVLWRRTTDDRWHAGTGISFPPPRSVHDFSPDGASLLAILCDDDLAGSYTDFAGDYHEVTIDRAAVAHVVAMHPLTAAVAHALNPDADLAELRAAGHLTD